MDDLGFASQFDEDFSAGAARAFWVNAWAYEMEEAGKKLSGDLMEAAPPTPLAAFVVAGELMGALAAKNKVSVVVLGSRAAAADGAEFDDFDADDFGHYMAMEAMGSGVSWFDDHAEFKFKGVHVEGHFAVELDD